MSSTPTPGFTKSKYYGTIFVNDIEGYHKAEEAFDRMPTHSKVTIVSAFVFLALGIVFLCCQGENCYDGLYDKQTCSPKCSSEIKIGTGLGALVALIMLIEGGIRCCTSKTS